MVDAEVVGRCGRVEGRRYLFLSLLKAMGRRVGFQKPRELNAIEGGPGFVCVVDDELEDPGEKLPGAELELVKSDDVSVLSSHVAPDQDDGSCTVDGRELNVLESRLDIRLLSLSSWTMLL